MTYRVYLRTASGQVLERTITGIAKAAEVAFETLVNRTDLDGKAVAVALTYNQKQVAFHRFDRKPGEVDYWRGKIGSIQWPKEA